MDIELLNQTLKNINVLIALVIFIYLFVSVGFSFAMIVQVDEQGGGMHQIYLFFLFFVFMVIWPVILGMLLFVRLVEN